MMKSQQGDIALYVALIIVVVMTSAAVVFTGLLSRQIPFTRSVVNTEQAFYAGNSGLEEALFHLAKQNENTKSDTPLEGEIQYSNTVVPYTGYATLSASGNTCAGGEATVGDSKRRVIMGGENCE